MESYRRRPPGVPGQDGLPGSSDPLNEAGTFLRRLIPFPGAEALSPLSLLPLAAQAGGTPSNPMAQAMPDIVGEQAASLVSQAAAILDEEMARGVLAARRSGSPGAVVSSDASNPVVRQMHELIESVAAMWPGSLATATQQAAASPAAGSDADALAEVRPGATVRRGERATISMTVSNSESRTVRLIPASTDLLGSCGGRIASALVECTPREFSLEPQEQRDLAITAVVPGDAAPGCYSGLLVVRGVDYLRALITIEVV